MRNTDYPEKKKPILWLLVIYAASVTVRCLLAMATKDFPTVYIDEYLYYGLGRSVATSGSLTYFGQPAVYNYIIYPLIISPVYGLFGYGANYFRLIQVWNILLMSLSVFPIYGLCHAMVLKRKTALLMTGLFMLMPCFILGEFVYSEAVIYPMFFALMYCIYQNLRTSRIKYTAWIGVLGAMLFFSKPGAIVPAAAGLLFFAGRAAVRKDGKAGLHVLAGAGCLAVSFIAMKLIIEKVLGYQGSLLSVYDEQVSLSYSSGNEYFFRSVGKYPYYFILAGSLLPFMASLWYFPEYDREDKQFYVFAIICSLLTMVGTAWVVNRPEHKDILFLRYVEMYLPVLLTFIMIPRKEGHTVPEKSRRAIEILCVLILVYMTVCTVVWGSTTGIGETKESHFLISLAALFTGNVMGTANIIIVFLAGLTLYLFARKTDRKSMTGICCATLVLFTVLNNIAGYITTSQNSDSRLADETAEIHQRLGDREYVHVYTGTQCDYGLDVNSRRNISWITEKEFLNNIMQNHGVYVPFVPSSARGMRAVYKTPDTDTLIVDENIYQYLRFSNTTSSFVSKYDSFEVVSFSKGERIVDSVMARSKNKSKDAADSYTLIVYNEEWLTHPVKIRLNIQSPSEQDFMISANGDHAAKLQAGSYWYEIETRDPASEYQLTAMSSSIQISDYEIMTLSE